MGCILKIRVVYAASRCLIFVTFDTSRAFGAGQTAFPWSHQFGSVSTRPLSSVSRRPVDITPRAISLPCWAARMNYSVTIPWQPGSTDAPIPVPATPLRAAGISDGFQGHDPGAVSILTAFPHEYCHVPAAHEGQGPAAVPASLRPSSYFAHPSASTSLGAYHDALKTSQQRAAEAAVTYSPGPSVPTRRNLPPPEVGMRYKGGATGKEDNHGTAFSVEDASKHLLRLRMWTSCYGWARTFGYFLGVVGLLLLAVVVDALPLDAAADAIDPSRAHGSARHQMERQLSKQQRKLDQALKDREDMNRKLHKKLRKKALKEAKNFAQKQPNTHMSKVARQEAVVQEFMRDPEEFTEDKDAVLEVTRTTAALEAAKRRQKQAADELMRKVSHDLEAVHQLPPDILRNAVKHGVGGTAVKAAVKVSEWKKEEKERKSRGKKKGRRMLFSSSSGAEEREGGSGE